MCAHADAHTHVIIIDIFFALLLFLSSRNLSSATVKFLLLYPTCSGHVSYHDFLKGLRLKNCTLAEEVCHQTIYCFCRLESVTYKIPYSSNFVGLQIFAFIDVENNGSITFKQVVFSNSLTSVCKFLSAFACVFSPVLNGS